MENYYRVVSNEKEKEITPQIPLKVPQNCLSVRCIQKKKRSIWPLVFISALCAIGLILIFVVVVSFKQYYVLFSFFPLFFMATTIIIFGIPFPFVLTEFDLLFIFYPEDEEWKHVGHFLLSMWFTGIFGVLIILYVISKLTKIGLIISIVAHLLLSITALLFMIRYHYIRNKDDDEDESSDEE